MKDNVLRSCHDQMSHFGVEKVENIIMKIPLVPKIQTYIRNCLSFIEFSPQTGKFWVTFTTSLKAGTFRDNSLQITQIHSNVQSKNKNIFLWWYTTLQNLSKKIIVPNCKFKEGNCQIITQFADIQQNNSNSISHLRNLRNL